MITAIVSSKHGGLTQFKSVPKSHSTWVMAVLKYRKSGRAVLKGIHEWHHSGGQSSGSRWEGMSCRQEEGKCQSLALIGTMVDLALVSFLAELGMTMFLFSDTLLLYSYVLRFKRKGDNVHTIGSIMILHLGIW